MTAEHLVYPVLVSVAGFIIWFAVILLGFSLLRMIGRDS